MWRFSETRSEATTYLLCQNHTNNTTKKPRSRKSRTAGKAANVDKERKGAVEAFGHVERWAAVCQGSNWPGEWVEGASGLLQDETLTFGRVSARRTRALDNGITSHLRDCTQQAGAGRDNKPALFMPNNMSPNDLVEKQLKELECLSETDRNMIDSMVLSFALRLMPLHRDLRRIIARQLQDSDEK